MAFGSLDPEDGERTMAEINMVPLIDVMLVLLIIFIVTAPLLSHSIRIDLPQASSRPTDQKPEIVALSLDAQGAVYWNDAPITEQALRENLAAAARLDPQPELHLHADRTTQYQKLAEVLAAAQTAGIARVGFITEPPPP
jgi:biopolymer transport protein ExbD